MKSFNLDGMQVNPAVPIWETLASDVRGEVQAFFCARAGGGGGGGVVRPREG